MNLMLGEYSEPEYVKKVGLFLALHIVHLHLELHVIHDSLFDEKS